MLASPAEYTYLLRRDFMAFIERSFYELNPLTRFIPGRHIELIAAKLEACRQGKIKRLIINVPPRGLKSHCVSIAFVAWWLGHNPSGHVICASYGQELAEKLARDCRIVMQSAWYEGLFGTRLAGRQATHDFTTTALGTRFATSVGGVLTGRGADLIILDDPLKPDEALSETRRTAVNEWYDNTLLSRLNDKANGCIIIIMQRLHQDDLVGHVLEQEHWDVLALPALAEEDETHTIENIFGQHLFRRKKGDPLHPEREPLSVYEAIRRTIGEYNFTCQYQQNPSPPGGALIKTAWLRYYEPGEQPAKFSQIVQSWDTANKSSELSDHSVGTTWGVLYRKYYLLDVFRRKLNYPDLKRAILEQAMRYGAKNIVIEDKASGIQLIQDLNSELVSGVNPYKPPPGADKVMRLHSQTAQFGAQCHSENQAATILAVPWTLSPTTAVKGLIHSPADRPLMTAEERTIILTAIAKARDWIDELAAGRVASFAEIAKREGKVERHIRLLAPLAFLSPEIVSALIEDTATSVHVTELAKNVPYNWTQQKSWNKCLKNTRSCYAIPGNQSTLVVLEIKRKT